MGHRALVARERPGGRYDLHRSQWGGADLALARTLDRGPWPPAAVDADPVATGVTRTGLLAEHLDPLVHEALYVRPLGGRVDAYRTLWLGDLADGAATPGGLLVAVDRADPCDDALVRGWFAGARAVATAARERGGLEGAAATVVERRLRDWAGDREVLRLPP